MATRWIDIHPHIISADTERYPHGPLFGIQSDWSKERPVTPEGLITALDEAGIEKAAIVQSSTCYGYDNSYVVDTIAQHPLRFTGVGSVDMLQDDASERIRYWLKRGITGRVRRKYARR